MSGRFETVAGYAISIGVALALSAGLVQATGGSATGVLNALIDGSLLSPGAWGLTLTTMGPLLLVAVGSIVSTRGGLVNIGQEGQVVLGAGFAAFAAVRLGGPSWVVITTSIIFGAVGGAIWAGLAAGLKRWRNVPEVLSTLLLTFIAFPLLTFGLRTDWLVADRRGGRSNQINAGERLPESAQLPQLHLFGNDIDLGFVIAVAVWAFVAWMMTRTMMGARIDVLGLNARAARRFGVDVDRMSTMLLMGAGASAGAAGAVLLQGGAAGDRLVFGMSGNVGWDGLLVALLARHRLIMAIPMAFVFAMLRTGSSFLAATGVDRRMTDVVQALLVLALLVPPAVGFVIDRRRSLHAPVRGASRGRVVS